MVFSAVPSGFSDEAPAAQGIDDPVFGAPVRFTAQAMTIGTPSWELLVI